MMMLVTRLVLVVTALVLAVHGEEVGTPVAVRDDVVTLAAPTRDRQRVDKGTFTSIIEPTGSSSSFHRTGLPDAAAVREKIELRHRKHDVNTADNRQGRMALHAEAPSSKAKREQALRNILAARRRQFLGPRVSEAPRSASPSPRKSRPTVSLSRDPPDMLEAQETRHGIYVTAPIGDEVSIVMENDEDDTSKFASPENPARSPPTSDDLDRSSKNSLLIRINDTDSWLSALSRDNDTSSKNSSVARAQKILDHDIRRKNTVAMPESLYNHFRPVESNIPVEDMTQFLYFGQKIPAESHNSTGSSNNSVLDGTSTSSSVASSRRRYSMKRFSTTTPITVPRLEEIVNEEMNIALERSTIERNKIPKTKNQFRPPGTGTYFRKSSVRSSDPTIVSNVILSRESSRNASAVVSEDRRESVPLRNSGKFHSDQSAHALQVVIVEDGGSGADTASAGSAAAAHRAGNATAGNAADSTQLPRDTEEAVSKVKRHQRKDHSPADDNGQSRNSTANTIGSDSLPVPSMNREIATSGPASSASDYDKTDEKLNKITTWQTVHSNEESTTFSTRTMNDLTETPQSRSHSTIATSSSPAHSGSLRIVVTEPMPYDSRVESGNEDEVTSEDTSKSVDEGAIDRSNSRLTENPSTPSFLSANESSSTDASIELTLASSIANKRSDTPVSSSVVKTETKQHHAYAYEITNVTRLLRNYTGPGLSAASEQQPGRENGEKEDIARETDEVDGKRSTTTKKGKRIEEPGRTVERGMEVEDEEEGGSALRRTDVGSVEQIRNGGGSARPTPQRQPLPLLLPTLQRSSSSSGGTVEPARTTGELSAGTDVGETTATSTGRSSTLNSSNAGTTIIISAGGNSYTPSETAVSRASGGSSQAPSSSASSHSYHLVGERGRKGAAGAKQQYHQQNQNRGSGGGIGIGSRNTSPTASTPVATTEVSGASTAGVDQSATSLPAKALDIDDHVTDSALPTSTLRWNHTGINRAAAGGVLDRPEALVSDRRYMRKSVSAVLNQRTVEEGLTKESKRRRGGSLFSAASVNSRRIKNSRIGASEESRVLASRSMENRTGLTENGEAGSGTSQATVDLDGVAIQRQSDRIGSSAAMTEKQLESTEKHSLEIESQVDSTSMAMDKVQETTVGTTIAPTTTLESPSTRLTDGSKDQTEKVYASAQSVEQSNATDGDSASFPNETTNDSSESLSTLTPSTTSSSNTVETTKEVESTTVPAPPAFPVTPRMLKEDDEVTEVNVESADETKRNGTQEADRPFGLAKDLDPSEIQKMYRSQTTLKPEVAATTMIPQDIERSTDYPVTTTAAAKDQSRTMNPVNSSITRRPAGGERSPEVRGRNLSDKSKDKDDVLPIMQLYNTSNIFNGTAKDSQEAVSTARPLALPGAIEVNATRTENESDSPSATTLEPETSESSARQRNPEDRRTVNKNQEDNQATGIPKRNRHGDGTEESHESVLPATRWSNHSSTGSVHNSSGAYANRTRNRPTYYHTTPPEFVGYRPEFNSSFFEPGMISVSPRESVNVSEVITKRHDGDTIATQETVAVVAYILATLVVFPIAVGVGLILRRLIIRNRKVLEESDTSSEISCRKDALNLENGDFKTSIEKAITKLPRIQHLCHDAEKPPPPPTQESRWEFPRDKLRLQTVLGQGNFGQVWKAEADDLTGHQGTTRLVAVKTVKEGASAREKEDLVRELEIMQQLGNHPNVVTLLGCCTEEEPHYLILEYVMYGKLLAYLRDHRTRQDFYNFSEDSAALTSRDLTVFGYCVARGMEYLASKKIIHRDLAARNVLVDHNKLCKIADFGMSRFANDDGEVIEARHGRNALPIRWMAPESLIYSLFTTKTDVWSFGILMWEIVTLGSTPYPDMAAREVMRNVQNGYRLERPSHCRSELFRVIARCWHADPDRRPEFQILRRDMAQLLEDSMNGHYVDLESFASECTD